MTLSSRPVAWTQEQIEAWVTCSRPQDLYRWPWTTENKIEGRRLAARLVVRGEILRLCPEVLNYDALVDRLRESFGQPEPWFSVATDSDLKTYARDAIAALWKSISESVEDEAR